MPRGIFAQCCTILLREPVDLAALKPLLAEFEPQWQSVDVDGGEDARRWLGRDHLTFAVPNTPRGKVMVDVIDRPWPDDMGDPATNPMVFGAWSIGGFGPGTFPGSLERAMQRPWCDEALKSAVQQHRAVLRLRSTHIAGQNDPIMPADYDPWVDFQFLCKVVRRLLDLPAAAAYFNPNAEALWPVAYTRDAIDEADRTRHPPLQLWNTPRITPSGEPGRFIAATVGMDQFQEPDIETVFDPQAISIQNVQSLVLDISGIVLSGGVERLRKSMRESGGKWEATQHDESRQAPPRRVLRLQPASNGRSGGFFSRLFRR